MNVLVTNAKNRIAYSVARSLSPKGIEVITADSVKTAMTFYSKYSAGNFIYPNPFKEENAFIRSIIQNCKKYKIDVLIPVYEETFIISRHKKLLSDHVKLMVPDYDQILAVHNKIRLYRLGEQLGISVPRTYRVDELKLDYSLMGSLKFPVLLKPNQGGGAWGIQLVSTLSELTSILDYDLFPNGLPGERFLVQEKIMGSVSCCGMLMRKGEYQAAHCYRQLRETPISGGTATYRESIIAPKIVQYLRKLLEHLRWDGVCHADFLVEEETGIPYLIDANPRLWGSLFQSVIAGVDFPLLLCKLAMGEKIVPVSEYDTSLRSRWLWGDLKSLMEYLLKPELRGEIHLKDYFRFRTTDRYDDFQLTDPVPFFAWFADYLYKSVKQRTLSPVPHDTLEGTWE